jgi:arylsulfatase
VPESIGLSPRHPEVPPWAETEHKDWQQRRMEVYAAQITIMDTGIGKVLDALKETRRFENTLIFFTVDNGGCHVEYGVKRKGSYLPAKTRAGEPVRPGNVPGLMPGPENTYQSYGYGWANASNTPYRLFKQFDHEGGIRTPMIVHWPQGIKSPGKLVQSVSHLIDIMPTVLEACQLSPAKTINDKPTIPQDGHSLAAAFRDERVPDHDTLFFHHAKGRALRHGQWKLVSASGGKWELYDLAKDPLELTDLAAENPTKLSELEAMWNAESKRHANQAALK